MNRRSMLFRRDFRAYYGGHGKVWDYYRHVAAHPAWTPAIHLTPGSIRKDNPWAASDMPGAPAPWEPQRHDALFLAGEDWQDWPQDEPARPVINLVQGLRHADPAHPTHAFLHRRAVRICVSHPVAEAILATGRPRGPVHVIENAVDLPAFTPAPVRAGVLVLATKQPQMGADLSARLHADGIAHRLLDQPIPRRELLEAMSAADIAVLLPFAREGFYLPALEAMALGCAAVVPDCIGNRGFCRDEDTALMPAMRADALHAATRRLLHDPSLRAKLVAGGLRTAATHSLQGECDAFHGLLDRLDELWAATA